MANLPRATLPRPSLKQLPAPYRRLVESVSEESDTTFFYLKPGWVRDDDVHHVSYEPGAMEWGDVLRDFAVLKPCRCQECESALAEK